MAQLVKTIKGLAIASCKTVNGLAIASAKTINGLDNTGGGGSTLLTDIIAYWKLDEASGTRNDSVGSTNLSDNNTVTSATGKINNAGQFVAANSEYLEALDNAAMSVGAGSFTFTCWVNLASKATYQSIVSKANFSAPLEYHLIYHPAYDNFMWLLADSGGTITELRASTFGSPSTSTWYFLAAWYDSGSGLMKVSVNNGTVDTVSGPTPFDGASRFRLGAYNYSAASFPMDGMIDEVGFWKRTLTAGEITSLYNGSSGLSYPF